MKNNKIKVTGMNHLNSAVDIREKFHIDESLQLSLLKKISSIESIDEVMVLSTCNRTDVYYVETGSCNSEKIIGILETIKKIDENYREKFYTFENMKAVEHIFRVVSSLNSMVVGENDITNQFKKSFNFANENGFIGNIFLNLFHHALGAEKLVKSKTEISRGTVSMSYCAVEFASKIFDDFSEKNVLIIGAGTMARDASLHFIKKGIKRINVLNKTYEKAVELSKEFNGKPYKFEELEKAISENDIILSSTGSKEPIIKFELIEKIMKKPGDKILHIIDIAVPRDVEYDVKNIKNVHMNNIDDLKKMIDKNIEKRKGEVSIAEEIIMKKIEEFRNNLHVKKISPGVIELRKKIYKICNDESQRCIKRYNLNEEMSKIVEENSINVVNKIIGIHMAGMKRKIENNSEDIEELLRLMKESFEIYE